jgi:HK97 family phage prohead protease/HK97 family phage major capsid protein
MRLEAELPDNYRPATDQDVPEGQACGNCAFFNEEDVAPDGRARCTQWDEYVEGGYYCNSWQARAEASKDEDEEDEDTYMAPDKPTITLSFSADVTAADVDRRTIVGRILPFGEIGNTSLGPVVFEQGSIVSPGEVKLLLEHDGRRPIGKSTAFVSAGDHMTGSFKISNTTAGTDALIEAADGLRNGLSVGANILEHTVGKNGVMTVTSAELVEVSLVTSPAFAGAQVTQVAASTQPEGQKMEEQTVEVAATEAAPSTPQPVEAATPMVASATPSVPYATAQPRDLKGLTAGGMLRAQLRASFGDHDSQMLVKAALGEQTTTRDGGVIPVPLLREIIGVVDDTRYFVNSIDRQALPDAGMSFRIPKITTLPSVAEQTTELDEVASVQSRIEDITVNVKTFAGGNKVSRQLIERSDPAYFDELLRQLAARYAQATDVFAYTQAIIGQGNSDGETIYDSIAVGIADSYSVMRFTPNRLLVAPTSTGAFDYKDLLSEVDQGGRPLFAAALPQNAAGLVTQGSTQGTVAGLQLVVNPNLQGLNINPRVYPSAFATFYETAGSPVRVELRHADDLSVDVSLYGYVALANKYPTALRNLTVTPPSTS